jgi:hypothetical protein
MVGVFQKMALKKDIIMAAARELRISGLTSTLTNDEVAAFLYELEGMMAQLLGSGYDIGYVFTEESDPNDDLGVSREYWPMMQTRLAVQMSPSFGMGLPLDLVTKAKQAYTSFLATWNRNNLMPVVPSRRMPIGSGNTFRGSRYNRFNRPQPQAQINQDNTPMSTNDILDTAIDFTDWLTQEEGDYLMSFEIEQSNNLTIQSSGQTDFRVEFRVKVDSADKSFQQVMVTATAASGRVTTRYKNFVISEKGVIN